MKMREKWESKDRIKPKKHLRILKPSLRMRKPLQTKICLELKSIYLNDSIIFFKYKNDICKDNKLTKIQLTSNTRMLIENWKSLKEIAKEWLKELKNLNPNQEKSRPRFKNCLSEKIENKKVAVDLPKSFRK